MAAAGVEIAASLLAASPLTQGAAARAARAAGVDLLHLDIMDGHFVPAIAGSVDLVRALAAAAWLPLDVHLMLAQPTDFLAELARLGVRVGSVSVHVELGARAGEALVAARAVADEVGVAVSPDTPLEALTPLADGLDWVLVMAVPPGRAGQAFQPAQLDRVRRLAAWARARARPFRVAVDGGVGPANAAALVAAGARRLVAGAALFGTAGAAAGTGPGRQRLRRALGELRSSAAGAGGLPP